MSNLSNANQRLAGVLAVLTLIGAIALPVMATVIWLFWGYFAKLAAGNLGQVYDVATVGTGARLAGFALFMVGASLQSYGLLGVRNTFLEAKEGRSFSVRSIKGFRRFAWVSLVMVIWGIVQRTGIVVILSLSDPSHPNAISILFGSNEVKALFMALLLVFVAHVLTEGKHAKDETDSFL